MSSSTTDRLVTPSQLALFSRSPVIGAWWEELAAQKLFTEQRPDVTSLDELLFASGLEHEEVLLADLEASGADVHRQQPVDPDGPPQEQDYANTLAAMREGRQFIHQAALRNGEIRGWADLLERVDDKPSVLGSWSYRPIECKLSSHPKPIYLVQACAYCELLEPLLGHRPEQFRLYLGGKRFRSYDTSAFWAWYEQLRQRYRDFRASFDPLREPEDEPGDHGLWTAFIDQRLEEKKDLILVAGMRRTQRAKLCAAGIHTIDDLAALEAGTKVSGLDPEILDRLRTQAEIQTAPAQPDGRPPYRVRPADQQERGLCALPLADEGDVWFDMEGYPDPITGSKLEYLFGVCFRDPGSTDIAFKAWWAHVLPAEKAAFEGLIDWIAERRQHHPGLHVYHYASYEKTALGTLAASHQTRERLIDQWLSEGVLVDLYPIVRHGLLLGAPSYSIKKVELLYQPARDGAVETAADSVVQYAEWLRSCEPQIAGEAPAGSPRLQGIEDYNRDDCLSTARLHDFLLEQRRLLGLPDRPLVLPGRLEEEAEFGLAGAAESSQAKRNREAIETLMRTSEILLEELPTERRDTPQLPPPGVDDPAAAAIEAAEAEPGPRELSIRLHRLLAQLLPFHLRERKVEWWTFFDRLEQNPDERFADAEVIAAATLESIEEKQTPRATHKELTYRFDTEQPLKLRNTGGNLLRLYLPGEEVSLAAQVHDEDGTVVLKLSGKKERERAEAGLPISVPERTDLILFPPDISQHLRHHLSRQASCWVDDHQALPAAMHHLFERRAMPELEPINTRTRQDPGSTASDLASFLATADGVALALQGPPGTGKTTVTAEVITQLVAQGQRVAVSSNSHPAINHLLRRCQVAMESNGSKARVVKCTGSSPRPDDEQAFDGTGISCVLQKDLRPEMAVVGGTVFVFAKHVEEPFDLLVIDEAGQVSLANLLAMASCARNILVVGDQQQLSQPTRAAHPGDSGLSCLDYVMEHHAVVPPDRGLFLATSWRMAPPLAQVVSELFYKGELTAARANSANRVEWSGPAQGLLFLPSLHSGNSTGSDEEVDQVAALVAALRGQPFQRAVRDGIESGVLDWSEILITAPYNVQVSLLKRRLGPEARIGTVDKFQGQEAAVAIHSLTSSDAEQAPRGLGFLLDPHRLNVAISRGQCLSMVLGSPTLSSGIAAQVDEVIQLNRLCRLMAES
ncbi:TM0106 family RecB-like putative nuclease [Synechococcus sp. EJ6-Ellesmere]|uniref:TM0106 family RecB-like putative nuclease n=1 Tax=Synechococcus sp. EJ6-Ellesmere TaxID=2823734 RepID=UPI0020CD8F6D|nr:TM0106 family RecB-like putative nuclease [Synechococcus sp. EJ6-Ellesmere]MCP9826277.1 TM0106 family RecB-like putative nuclease [Synechococcus sp. EJ6-Ellesmere]